MKKVVIIGAGIGGLATAVRLLNDGYDVLVLEKESKVGGKINSFEKNGYKFDLTSSILMTPHIYKDLFKDINKDYRNYIKFIDLEKTYRVFYSDNTYYDFYHNNEKNNSTIERISKRNVSGYNKFIDKAIERYQITEKYFLKENLDKISNLLNVKRIIPALKLAPIKTSEEFINMFIDNDKLMEFLLFQSMYVGVSPYNSSNLYTLVPAITQKYGLSYLKGGMYSYIEALEKLVLEMGGEIITNREVKQILVKNGKVKGVLVRNGEYSCDIVVCNADFSYAVTNLLKKDKYRDGYTIEKINKMKYSCSVFMLYIGTDKKYENLQVHNISIEEEFRYNTEAPFRGKLSSNPSMYIYCPSRVDNSLAKNNGETINIMIRVPNLIKGNINWNSEMIAKVRGKIISKLKEIDGLEDIDEHIVVEEVLTPNNIEEVFNAYGGAAFGLSHTLTQTTYFRPHIKSKDVNGLYYVGGSIHPGVGASIVLLGAKVTEETIVRDNS